MAHLVKPILRALEEAINLEEAIKKVQQAHKYLVRHGIVALQNSIMIDELPQWGSQMKRIQVEFSPEDRPELIDLTLKTHSLTEVYNQCASIERLLDALNWAQDALQGYKVVRCHPTTSSAKHEINSDIPDNDLVLVNSDGKFARFEVSDVISAKRDSNQKLTKDLKSLGVIASLVPGEFPETWSKSRLFLVVSTDFANLLKKPTSAKQKPLPYRYEKHDWGDTCIVEVLPVSM